MDAERFDRLTRQLATPRSRRSLLRGALATGAAWLAGRVQSSDALAQSQCAPFYNIPCQSDVECQGVVGAPPVCFQLACCGGICEDVTVSGTNCGACGISCPPGATCENGQCISSCQPPLVECNGLCVDIASDPNNCGGCFDVCEAGKTCANGMCTCGSGLTDCFGACVDLSSDPSNCGSCGGTCPAGTTCAGGTCGCANGLTSCNGVCVDSASDPNNCGGCFAVCGPDTACVGGVCTCGEGLANCNGVCVALASDAANCGACGVICPDGGACVDGTCQVICPAGMEACDGTCVDMRVDPANCGACGNRCPDGTSCEDGQCPVWEFNETVETVLEVPGPELCIAPRPSRDDLQRLLETSAPTPVAEAALPAAVTPAEADALVASGTDVDDSRRQAGLAVVRAALGCENTGDPLRELGGMTDTGIRATLVDRGWTPEIIGLLGNEEMQLAAPLPHDRRIGISGSATVRALPDGRLIVRVPVGGQGAPVPPTPDMPGERIYVLVDLPNGLMIDQLVYVNPNPGLVTTLTGSLAVQLEVCPPGMTYDDFVPSACEPVHIEGFAPAIFGKPGDPDDGPRAYEVEKAYFGIYQGYVEGLTVFTPAWEGYYLYIYGLELGRTYWIEPRLRGADVWGYPAVVPGTVGLSLASGPAGGRTFWGAALTVGKRDVVVRAYYFRSADCGRTCPGDQEECLSLLDGTSTWVDLSRDRGNCGRCGNRCPGGQNCVNGVCA